MGDTERMGEGEGKAGVGDLETGGGDRCVSGLKVLPARECEWISKIHEWNGAGY